MANKPLHLVPHSDGTEPLKPLKIGPQLVKIDQIRLRKEADTRPINAWHVVELAESIAVLGLLEPLVIDTEGHLLAGAHRFAALQLLMTGDRRVEYLKSRIPEGESIESSKGWDRLYDRVENFRNLRSDRHLVDGIPTLVVDVSLEKIADSRRYALAIEVAENNVRRSYTTDEVRELADRLKEAGYTSRPGRPKPGARTLISVLQAAVGKSRRTIDRIINGKPKTGKPAWNNAKTTFRRVAMRLIEEGKGKRGAEDVKLLELVRKALAAAGDADGSA
jgi:hypothetical protein